MSFRPDIEPKRFDPQQFQSNDDAIHQAPCWEVLLFTAGEDRIAHAWHVQHPCGKKDRAGEYNIVRRHSAAESSKHGGNRTLQHGQFAGCGRRLDSNSVISSTADMDAVKSVICQQAKEFRARHP